MQSAYGELYLGVPNELDVKKTVDENAKRGFPGMIGSIDCTCRECENCPIKRSVSI